VVVDDARGLAVNTAAIGVGARLDPKCAANAGPGGRASGRGARG